MFKVKKKATGKIYTVFAVQKDKFECTEFLIYDDTWGWVWRSPLDYVPVEVENVEVADINILHSNVNYV